MNNIIKNIEAAQVKAEIPVFHVGDTVKVYGKIKEGNRERVQVFEGVVLKRQGGGARETFLGVEGLPKNAGFCALLSKFMVCARS